MKNSYLRPLFVLFVPLLMVALPSSIEISMGIPVGGKIVMPIFDILAIYIILRSKSKINKSDVQIFFLYLLLLFFPTLLFRDYPIVRIFSSIQFFVGYFLASSYPFTPKGNKLLLYSSLAVFFFVIIQQIVFSLGLAGVETNMDSSASLGEDLFRAGTTVGTSNDTSHLMIILSCIILSYLNKEYLKIVMVLLMIVSSLVSGCRGSLVMCVFPILFFVFELKKKKGAIILIFVVIGFYYLATKYNVIEILKAREDAVLAYGDITSGRSERWEVAFNKIGTNLYTLLFGNGGGCVPHGMDYNVNVIASPHNCYIGILVETGIFGAVLFSLFLIRKFFRIKRFSYCVAGLLSIYLISYNTEVYGLTLLASFYFWIIYFLEINNELTNNIKPNNKALVSVRQTIDSHQ